MSKVVTIPKDRNPFVVIVNGVKHSYPAGVSTEVPDEVADVIEKYVGAKPKPNPNAGGGVSWNDLKDKPFGDANTVILEEQELQYDDVARGCVGTLTHPIHDGDALAIVYDGETYECTAVFLPQLNCVGFGNLSPFGGNDTGEPFFGLSKGDFINIGDIDIENTKNHTVKITSVVTTKIPTKYLPSVGGIKYVYINEDYDGNHTASATYAQIATWIKSGLDVKCIYFGRIVPLISSYVLSEITTYVQAACHEFTVMYDIAQGLKIQINDNDDINVYWIENIE